MWRSGRGRQTEQHTMVAIPSVRALQLAMLLTTLLWGSLAHQPPLLKVVAPTQLEFRLSGLDVRTVGDAALSISVPGWPTLGIRDEPDLPLVRVAMVLPHNLGVWTAVVRDVQKRTISLEGRTVLPSPGDVSICANDVIIPGNTSGPAYQHVYPQSETVSLGEPYTWRDVYGAVLEILPVTVDHSTGTMEVLSSCTVELVSTEVAPPAVAKKVDPDFHDAYSFVYANFDHYADLFLRDSELGRVLVVHEAKFKTHAQSYADWVKQEWSQEAVIYQAGSESDIKKTISQHYKEPAGLSYVTIIGRGVPSPTGSSSRRECDNCYAMMSGSTLDLFVGRLSGTTASDIDTQIAKFKAYSSQSGAAWTEKGHGSLYKAPWDPSGYEKLVKGMMADLGSMGFTEHEYTLSTASGAAKKNLQSMSDGIGVFGYIGHGSGNAWNTPSMGVRDVQQLTNNDKHFLSLDCSCLNGGFKKKSPCLAEALLTSKGGAIATMMSAPSIGTCCLDFLRASTQVLKSGKVSRVGPMYVAALTKAQAAKPDKMRTQSYNVFGDPTLKLAFKIGDSIVV